MAEKAAYVVDFDGTVTAVDLSTELARHFGGERFWEIESAYRQRKLGMRGWLEQMSALLPADWERLKNFSLKRAALRPGFVEFARAAFEKGSPVYLASDGFGFYIEPILKKFDCFHYIRGIYCNQVLPGEGGSVRILNPHAHSTCPTCGNCKAALVLRLKKEGWRVSYIGDGSNDRFGASWSHYIFARERLAHYCREHAVPHRVWEDFFDILQAEGHREGFANTLVKSPFCLPETEGYLY